MKVRFLVIGLVAVATVVITATGVMEWQRRAMVENVQSSLVELGGPFTMTAHDGRTVTEADLLGHRSLVFFGFTTCPDICPMTLNEIAFWLEALGEEGESMDAYFVSVDPERDTSERMGEYVGYFSPRITGLVGTDAQLAEMAKGYKAYYARIDLDDGEYLMDHTAAIYLMNEDGSFHDAITHTATREEAVAKLQAWLAQG